MTNEKDREPIFPDELRESERLMHYRSQAFEHNNLDAFLSFLGHYRNGEGWRATVEFHPDHPPSKKLKDGRSYLKLDLQHDGIHLAILSDLTFAEIYSQDDVRAIDKSKAIEIYKDERELIYAIGERFRQAVIWAKYLFPGPIPPEEPSIPKNLTPVGGR